MYIVDIEHNTTVITATQSTSSANIVNPNTSSEYYISQYINHNLYKRGSTGLYNSIF